MTKPEYLCLKSGFKCKKAKYKHGQFFFISLEFDFFRVPLKYAFRIWPYVVEMASKSLYSFV